MNQKTVWQGFSNLPPEAQQQVMDFIAFLQTRYAAVATRPRKSIKPAPLKQEDFIGMWRQRDDLQDSTAWVRQTCRIWTLEQLLAGVTPDNLHPEIDNADYH